jgi:DNA polymerase-3 subunit epsilon
MRREHYDRRVPSPDQPIRSSRIVVFDTETTGLAPVTDRIIEIAALALENGSECGRFSSLVDPGIPIPPELTEIHRITDEMVRGQPRFPEVAGAFLEFVNGSIVAAHNAPYDIAMLIPPLREAGLKLPDNPAIDTCRLARRLIQAPNYRLSTVARSLEIEMREAHRAMPDVETCAGVLQVCLSRMGAEPTLTEVERASATRLRLGTGVGTLGALPGNLAPIERAMAGPEPIEIVYKAGSHGERPRAITPLFLLELEGALSVAALCHIDGSLKNFRLDLIAGARLP